MIGEQRAYIVTALVLGKEIEVRVEASTKEGARREVRKAYGPNVVHIFHVEKWEIQ